jgi:hypothetical protein
LIRTGKNKITRKNQPEVAENNFTKGPCLASLPLWKYCPINIYTIKKGIEQVNQQHAREAGRLPDLLV